MLSLQHTFYPASEMTMTNHTALFTTLLTSKEHTVKDLVAATSLSESRVREILKGLPGVLTSNTKPARFWLSSPDSTLTLFSYSKWTKSVSDEATPVSDEATPVSDEATPETDKKDPEGCPFCGDPSSSITAAGEEGTFLGDSVNFCHGCGEGFHRFTKEKVDLPKAKGGKGRRLVNPQYKIAAKVAAVEKVGGTLEYRQEGRAWAMTLPGQKTVTMNSQEFARHTPETLIPEDLRK